MGVEISLLYGGLKQGEAYLLPTQLARKVQINQSMLVLLEWTWVIQISTSQACGSLSMINIMQQRPDTMASWLQVSERYGPLMPLRDSPTHRPPPVIDDDVNAGLMSLSNQSPDLIATR